MDCLFSRRRGNCAAVRRIAAFIALAACGGAEEIGDDRISRGSPDVEGWLDLSISGEGFDVVEGMPVVLQVGIPERPPERLGWAETTIVDGAFAIHLPDVLEPALYKRKVLWIDGNGDGACDPSDLVFTDYTLALDDLTIELDRYRETGDFAFANCDDVVLDWPAE
jgi:hypothetical protein